jgi:hypothetical protein
MEISCRNPLSSGLDFKLLPPTKLSQEEASTKVRCALLSRITTLKLEQNGPSGKNPAVPATIQNVPTFPGWG